MIDFPTLLFTCRCGKAQPSDCRARLKDIDGTTITYLYCRACGNLEQLFKAPCPTESTHLSQPAGALRLIDLKKYRDELEEQEGGEWKGVRGAPL